MLYDIFFNLNHLPFHTRLIIFFTFSISVIFSLSFHEFSHAMVAKKLGDNTAHLQGRTTLNPKAHLDLAGVFCFLVFGFGWAKPVPVNPYNLKNIKRDSFFISIAGIVVNLIFAFIFYPFYLLLLSYYDSIIASIFIYLFFYLYQTNLVLAVFNLIPIYPLDGFNALSSHMSYTNPFVTFMHKYGQILLFVVLIIFTFTNIFSNLVYYVGYPLTKFWSLIIPSIF